MLWGTLLTIELLICAVFLGLFIAMILTLCRFSRHAFLIWPVRAYVFAVRGTPLLVQFFLFYFGLSQFDAVRNSIFWVLLQKPFFCAALTLAINTSAYTSVLLTGAIRAIPKGEIDACKALGMSWFAMMHRVILPRAFRIALPAYSNEIVMVLKGSSLASTITLMELFGVTKQIISETYADIQFMLIAGIIYFILNALIIGAFRHFEGKIRVK